PTGLVGIVAVFALTYVASLAWLAEGSAFGVEVSKLEAPVKHTSRVEASEPAPVVQHKIVAAKPAEPTRASVAVSAEPAMPAVDRIGPVFSALDEAKNPQQQVAVHDPPAPAPAQNTEPAAEAA